MSHLSSPPAALGERIRWARKRAGLSLDRLGEQVGTSRQHLIRLEKGQHTPRHDLLDRIAWATGHEPTFFGAAVEGQTIARERQQREAEAVRELVAALMKAVEAFGVKS